MLTIGAGWLDVTNFDALKYKVASKEDYFMEGDDLENIFSTIFNDLNDPIDKIISTTSTSISISNIIIPENLINGKWICLKNDSECTFRINDDNTMEGGIDIDYTKIILKEGDTPKEGEASGLTLVEWSNKGYIGKHNNYLYLNLEKFSASGEITVEIVQ